MLGVAMYTKIKTLRELGKNKSEIARLTAHDWKTVSKVVKDIESAKGFLEMKERQSIVEPFKEKVIQLLESGLSGVRIYEEIVAQGFSGSYSAVKKYIRRIKGRQIAIHGRLSGRGQFSTDESHYPKYKRYSETEHQEGYQVKMADIGVFAEQLFFLILKEMKNYWHQPVKGILSLTKRYPKEIVDLACKRALAYGACHYQTVKKICESGAYVLPVDLEISKEAIQ